jgi:hypothetical protein
MIEIERMMERTILFTNPSVGPITLSDQDQSPQKYRLTTPLIDAKIVPVSSN